MASNFKISTLSRDKAADVVGDQLNGGTIAIRTLAPPANVSDASAPTLLATLGFSATAFGASSTGTKTANAITSDTSADASGDAGHFRCYPSAALDTAAAFQGTAGVAADTPDLTFDNKSIVLGGTVAISSMTLTMPIQ